MPNSDLRPRTRLTPWRTFELGGYEGRQRLSLSPRTDEPVSQLDLDVRRKDQIRSMADLEATMRQQNRIKRAQALRNEERQLRYIGNGQYRAIESEE